MGRQTLMLIGGSATTNDDHGWLLAHHGANSTWSSPKNAQIGDHAYIYIAGPVSQVFATARVMAPPRPGKEVGSVWRYVCKIGPIRLLPSPIHLSELKELCPDWGWLRYPRAYAYIPPDVAAAIDMRARQRIAALPTPAETARGAGFGSWEDNRRVERAAVRAVTAKYRRDGFRIVSREEDRIGYDLDVTKGRIVRHVEVKGVSGETPSFPITANEVRRAEADAAFRALSANLCQRGLC